jgi:NADPH:quinone reductase-like Zn-dependent oxidoreductase
MRVEEYVTAYTEGKGFDIVYDTVGGATLGASFDAAKRHTSHVLSCLRKLISATRALTGAPLLSEVLQAGRGRV